MHGIYLQTNFIYLAATFQFSSYIETFCVVESVERQSQDPRPSTSLVHREHVDDKGKHLTCIHLAMTAVVS